MKYTLPLLMVAALFSSCFNTVPPVPENNRKVVRPQGSTPIEKAWGGVTKQEGEAALGPLSGMRR